ncbi:hypothetical protein BH10ACT1_BH10ACT1_15810 [soil metagenome]
MVGYNGRVSLKRELESPASPIRRFLDRRLPGATAVLDPWRKALRNVRPHLPPTDPSGGPTPNAVLGHAINARVSWDFAPADRPDTRAGGRRLIADGASAAVIDEVLARLAGPIPQHPYDAARLAWFAGLFDRAERSQRWDEDWYQPILTAETADELLLQVPAHWAADIVAVERAATRSLAELHGERRDPRDQRPDATHGDLSSGATSDDRTDQHDPNADLEPAAADLEPTAADGDTNVDTEAEARAGAPSSSPPPPAVVGATFAGSDLVGGAEADLVANRTVVDFKLTATTKTRLRDLHQVLTLALLDFDDAYGITHVALAPVRFGVLVRWDLAELIDQLADRPTDLADLRLDLRDHLERAVGA